MNKPLRITVVDHIQGAEKRYYVALQKYDQALRTATTPDNLDRLRIEVCEAFAELRTAHERLMHCDERLQPAANA